MFARSPPPLATHCTASENVGDNYFYTCVRGLVHRRFVAVVCIIWRHSWHGQNASFFRVSWCLASVKIMWHWPHSYLISNVAISFVAPVAKRLKEKVRQCVRVYAVCSHIRTQHSTNIWTHCVITLCVWAQSTESSCTIANIAPNVADSNGTPWLHSLWSRYNEPKRLNVCPCVTIFSSDILTTFMQSLNE